MSFGTDGPSLRSLALITCVLQTLRARGVWGVQNKMHINDWSAIQTLFDKLNKQVEKAQKVTETLGAPRVYIKMLVELEVRLLLYNQCLRKQQFSAS